MKRAAAVEDEFDRPMSQRLTSVAASGVQKPVGAMSSVFDVARPPKKSWALAPLVDFGAIEVEDGVPLPTERGRKASRYDALLSRLAVGESAAMPLGHINSLRIAMRVWTKKRPGQTFTTRKVSETDVRVWRTA